MNQFDRLEKLAQQLIEGPFRLFSPTRLHLADLAEHLLAEVEMSHRHENGENLTPNEYRIIVNPADYARLVEECGRAGLKVELGVYLTDITLTAGYGPLRIALTADDIMAVGQVMVQPEGHS